MTTTVKTLDWVTEADAWLISAALSHYDSDSLTGGLQAPFRAGDIRAHWPEPEAIQGATYGALLASDALYRNADRLWRGGDRAMASRTSELGLAFAAGRLQFERLVALPEVPVQISPEV